MENHRAPNLPGVLLMAVVLVVMTWLTAYWYYVKSNGMYGIKFVLLGMAAMALLVVAVWLLVATISSALKETRQSPAGVQPVKGVVGVILFMTLLVLLLLFGVILYFNPDLISRQWRLYLPPWWNRDDFLTVVGAFVVVVTVLAAWLQFGGSRPRRRRQANNQAVHSV